MKATMVHAKGGALAAHEGPSDPTVPQSWVSPAGPQSWVSPAGLRCSFDERGRFHASPAQAAANGDNKAPAGPVDEAGARAARLGRLRARESELLVSIAQGEANHYPASILQPWRDELAQVKAKIAVLEPQVQEPGQSSASANAEEKRRQSTLDKVGAVLSHRENKDLVAGVDEGGNVRLYVEPVARPRPDYPWPK